MGGPSPGSTWCPARAPPAGLEQAADLAAHGVIRSDETVVAFVTGMGLKTVGAGRDAGPGSDPGPAGDRVLSSVPPANHLAMNKIDIIEKPRLRDDLPEFRPGDSVKVHVRVVEAGRERIQVFQGVVIRRSGGGLRETFTVRKISFGVGVERTFPVHSPSISRMEIVQKGRVRRAKLYYLRELRGKRARIRERREATPTAPAPSNAPEPTPAEGQG